MGLINDKINSLYDCYRKSPTGDNLSKLLEASAPLVRHIAISFGKGLHLSDAMQAGYEGVMKALKRYKPGFNALFSTYATYCIAGEIRHYLRREMKYYRPSLGKDFGKRGRSRVEDSYFNNEGYSINSSCTAVSDMENNLEDTSTGLVSIDQLDIDKVTSLNHESFNLPIEDRIAVIDAVRKLPEIKQAVIFYLFYKNKTQQQTADYLDINQRKVSRLLKSSLTDLRKYLTD